MNKEISFAADLERNILEQLHRMAANASAICPALEIVIAAETAWNELFELIAKNINEYPEPTAEVLAGCEKKWQKVSLALRERQTSNTESLTVLWMLYTLIERTCQYYQQAAANSAYPAQRNFFTELLQCKLLLKKRIDSIMRIMYNHVWAEVGFAPFLLGKD